jgi:acetaldehyde dehydrogenase
LALSCVVIGSGNIGTDLMRKLLREPALRLRALVGIDPASDGLARARAQGVEATADGIDWVEDHAEEIDLAFEATSAKVHLRHAPRLREAGIAAVCPVPYAEIVSTVASRSAGPGTRQNIDEFTATTAGSLREVGGAAHGKAIIVLNPAEPPILMRNTVFCALPDGYDETAVAAAIRQMVARVAEYVPGYRLKKPPVFEQGPYATPGGPVPARVAVLLEVEGAGDYLPSFAGNLDIMTAAAVRVGTALADARAAAGAAV